MSKPAEQNTQFDAIRSEPVPVRLNVDAKTLQAQEGGTLQIPLVAFDNHPEEFRDRNTHKGAFRSASREIQKRDLSVSIPFVFREPGQVDILTPNLLFRKNRKMLQIVALANRGGVDAELTLTSSNGFLLKSVGDQPGTNSIKVILAPNTVRSVLVQPPSQISAGRIAEITVQGKGLTDEEGHSVDTQTIGLYGMQSKQKAKPAQQYLIGIDFGTAKSAVFLLDRSEYSFNQSAMQMRPINIPFLDGNELSPTVPSEMMFPETGGEPRFGFKAFSTYPYDLVVRSIKTLLKSDVEIPHPSPTLNKTYKPVEIVTAFLKEMVKHIRQSPVIPRNGPREDIFEQALIVLTLPILDDDGQFNKQKELTLQAARNAGLPEDIVIVCEKEPECAIVDILRRHDEYGLNIRDNDIGIIVDAGAGTLDISVLQVAVKDQQPVFTRLVLAGYPLGGDLIDALIYADMGYEKGLPAPANPKEEEERRRALNDLREDLRDMKHSLPLIPSDQIPDIETHVISKEFRGQKYELSWQKVHSLIDRYLEQALTGDVGLKESDVDQVFGRTLGEADKIYPSLRAKMKDIPTHKVAWICLTGGTSVVPLLRRKLQEMFSPVEIIPKEEQFHKLYAASPIFFTLNVAQGAAIRPLFEFEGLLSLPMRVECHSAQSGKMAAQYGSKPLVLEQPGDHGRVGVYAIEAADTLELRVYGTLEGTEVLWSRCFVTNPDVENPFQVSLMLHYLNNQQIALEVTSPLFVVSAEQSGSPAQDIGSRTYTIIS